MAQPVLAGIHHVKIPVTDLPRARSWYQRVFGFRVTMEFADADGEVRGAAGDAPGLGDVMLTLRLNPEVARACRGFDPVSFAVREREELDAWAAHLDELDIPHSPVIEASVGWILAFPDPDGISMHLYTRAMHGHDNGHRPGYARRVAPSPS